MKEEEKGTKQMNYQELTRELTKRNLSDLDVALAKDQERRNKEMIYNSAFNPPTPQEIKQKLQKEEDLRKKRLFRENLDFYIFSFKGFFFLESFSDEITEVVLPKEYFTVKLSDYYENAPEKTLVELLKEKGWKVEETETEVIIRT